MPLRYLDMVCEAIFTLNERGGATRDKIWNFLSSKRDYAASIKDKKVFVVQLRRILKDNAYVVPGKNNRRFSLTAKFKTKLVKHVQKGETLDLARKHAMVTKDNNKKKPVTKNKIAKASKAGPKGAEKVTKMKMIKELQE